MSSSSSSRASRRPSTATLQQFASSPSQNHHHHHHRGNTNGSNNNNGILPHKHSNNGDNTSATTAESTAWSSSANNRSSGSVFPRSHPNNNNNNHHHHHQQLHASSNGSSGRTISYFQQQQQQQQNQQQQNQSPQGRGGDWRYASPPSSLSGRSNSNYLQQPLQQQQQQQQRPTYRDDYSRSQHGSVDGDAESWNTPPPPPQQQASTSGGGGGGLPTVSDPGAASNRFAAYVNRFATADPRMDYTESLSPPASPRFGSRQQQQQQRHHHHHRPHHHHTPPLDQVALLEEKKEDANNVAARYNTYKKQLQQQNQVAAAAARMDKQKKNHLSHDYPDPDFGMEQMLAAEQAYLKRTTTTTTQPRSPPPTSRRRQQQQQQQQHGNSSETASVATTSVLHSPGANRTRDLARRFEERFQASSSLSLSNSGNRRDVNNMSPPPWHRETASYNQQQQQQQSRSHSQPPAVGRRTSPPFTTTTAAAVDDTALSPPPPPLPRHHQEDYRTRSEIETPSPARVSALKQKLWDASESLNVKVRPSSTGRGVRQKQQQQQAQTNGLRNARSLSPKTSRRVYQHFGNNKNNNHHYDDDDDGTGVATASHTMASSRPTHFEWTETTRKPTVTTTATTSNTEDDRSRSTRGGGDDRSYRSREERSYKSRDEVRSYYRDDRSRSSSHNNNNNNQGSGEHRRAQGRSTSNPRGGGGAVPPPSDPFEGSGGELQNSPFFKSRFFEAAEKTVDTRRSLSRANSSSSTSNGERQQTPGNDSLPTPPEISRQDSATRFFQRQLELAGGDQDGLLPMDPSSSRNMTMPSNTAVGASSSVGSGGRGMGNSAAGTAAPRTFSVTNSSAVANSYASTPIMTNRPENVASLLAKLQSVSRDNPTAALLEIDAILKAESSSSGLNAQSGNRQPPPPPPPPPPPAAAVPTEDHVEEEDEGCDSETETTVSSITNPTFSGHGKHRRKKDEYKKHHHHSSSHQPLPTTMEGEAAVHGVKPMKEPAAEPTESRRKKVRSPPPDTIQVSGTRAAARSVDRKISVKRSSLPVDMNDGDGRVVEALDKILQAPYDSTAELAEKIRRWDELSGKGSAPEVKTPEMMSDTTDALGSIVTASDGLPNNNKKKTHHPWDPSIPTRRGKIDVRDTSMENGTGIEAQYSSRHSPNKQRTKRRQPTIPEDERNNPFAQESDNESRSHTSPSREGSRSHYPQSTVVNMSAEFDDDWVTMPTSTFFQAETPQRRTATTTEQPSEGSPMPPPVSAKKASVEKFSPKRLDATNRELDYEPPSPGRHTRQSEGASVYDEKRLDQAGTDDECEDDGIEVTLVGEKKEPKRKGLRALLQRRNSKSNPLGSSTSVVSLGSRRRNQQQQQQQPPYKNATDPPSRPNSRGRRRSVTPSRERSHSLEEPHIRNPNIARKFSRLLRVYNDDGDRRPAEV